MSIVRTHKTGDYASISNKVLGDKRLSWAARGLLTYLLSKPDDWTVRMGDLIAQSPGSRTMVRGIFSELETYGYISRKKILGNGKVEWETTVYENPVHGTFSTGGKSTDGKPADILRPELTKTESKEKDSSPKNGDAPIPEKPRTEYVRTSEILEAVFAKARVTKLPPWEKDPKAANKRWRVPLNRMLQLAGGDVDLTIRGVREVVAHMKDAGLTFAAPDQIEKTFESWIIDQADGNRGRGLPEGF